LLQPIIFIFKVAKKISTHTREACRLSAIQLSFLILTFVGFYPALGLFVSVKVDPWHSKKIYAKAVLMSRPIFTKSKERGQNNFPNYASYLRAIFARSEITKISK